MVGALRARVALQQQLVPAFTVSVGCADSQAGEFPQVLSVNGYNAAQQYGAVALDDGKASDFLLQFVARAAYQNALGFQWFDEFEVETSSMVALRVASYVLPPSCLHRRG